ncbi:unnamed protein product [Microthlaspi erraticum]|uniref:FBD domain-containing protein n=1 Tax=Microthlaspi erraticum TaxID=1685480 RepID=A0A6D2KPW4_9BRAS|nr:unnamed protein product [Microthlaspi erraticum]
MSDSVKVDIDVGFTATHCDLSERNIIYNFLNHFSNARDMTLSTYDLDEIICYLHQLSPLPKFGNLTRLRVSIFLNISMEIMPFVLGSCPKLKHLNLELVDEVISEVDTIPSKLPFCLVSSLECVEMTSDITKEATERKVVRYFLDNATKLKKLVLGLNVYLGEKPHDFGLLKQEFDSPRRSGLCQLEVLPKLLKRHRHY